MTTHHRSPLRRLLAAAVSTLALSAVAVFATLAVSQPAAADHGSTGVQGIDVSHWQGEINWYSVRNAGVQFAFIKATEGTSYRDPEFNDNYPSAYYAGLIRGAYHFARPNLSGGAYQADFFWRNGGAWSADNQTLPGVLDIEGNPYSGGYCYGKSRSGMRNWILDFYNRYKYRTGRDVVIYTTASWWNYCTGSWTGMYWRSPLWVAHWGVHSPNEPAGWDQYSTWSFWQWTNCRSVSGISGCVDGNKWNGTRERLIHFANN